MNVGFSPAKKKAKQFGLQENSQPLKTEEPN